MITGKKIYLSGKVLRLDQEEHEDGLLVKHIEIVMWSNQTGMDLEEENIIIPSSPGRTLRRGPDPEKIDCTRGGSR